MQRSETDHHIYVQSLRNRWRIQSLKKIPSQGISINEAYTYFFGHLKMGDLCHFQCDHSPPVVGMISAMRYVVTSTHNKVHLWSSVLVGEEEYIFHTRIDNHDFNDALLYTKTQACSVSRVKVIGTL